MIYLKDEATCVTVEEDSSGSETFTRIAADRSGVIYATEAEADALLRGLLRWKLETTRSTEAVLKLVDEERRLWWRETR